MIAKDTAPKCVLLLIANGYEEIEAVTLLSTLRQAGLCVKCVGLTSGLVGGVHGVWLMPDLSFANLDRLLKSSDITLVILPDGRQSLTSLEVDPRVHRLLRRVVAQGAQIVATTEGLSLLQAADIYSKTSVEANNLQEILVRDPAKSPQDFAQDLIRRLLQSPRA